MQTTNFIKYISKPATVQIMAESEAMSLVKEFPYCQSGQLLLAMHLNQSNHLLFEQQLKKSAVYSSDRKKMFGLILSIKEEIQPQISKPKSQISNPKPQSIGKIVVAPKIVADEKNNKEKQLELEYINQAISNNYTIESLPNPEINREACVEERKQETEDGSQKACPDFFGTEVSHNPPLLRGGRESEVKEDGSKKLEDFDENSEFTFSDWLKHLSSGDKKNNNKPFGKSQTFQKLKKNKMDLIDKFIQEDPKIKPKKTEFYSPINMARMSVVDDSPLVSETLALIQVEQGSYEEAIKTYQKLCLENPEKRSYFANQIKILNQKIK